MNKTNQFLGILPLLLAAGGLIYVPNKYFEIKIVLGFVLLALAIQQTVKRYKAGQLNFRQIFLLLAIVFVPLVVFYFLTFDIK